MTEPRYYFYKMTADVGAAPCVIGEQLLTLAICKPRIRRGAKVDDFIFGFAGKTLGDGTHAGKLVYVARVDKRLSGREYYCSAYSMRPDCIYEWRNEYFHQKPNRFHGTEDARKDVGCEPEYKYAYVLVCKEFRYFGRKAWRPDKIRYPLLMKVLDTMRQGERVNHSDELKDELMNLQVEAFQRESLSFVAHPIEIKDGFATAIVPRIH